VIIGSKTDVLIVGGGLAGLVSSIDLALRGYSVQLLEQKVYPFHKVCGEYISDEVRPYLQRLGVYPQSVHPKQLVHFQLSAASGKLASTTMRLGGFGISRFAFDHFLAEKAKEAGVTVLTGCTAKKISYKGNAFSVDTENQSFEAKMVIGAYGKRSKLDQQLARPVAQKRSSYVGVKRHFKANFPEDVVALHHFEEGYCGLSQVETGAVNACYLTTSSLFKRYKTIEEVEQQVLMRNPHLKAFFESAEPLFAPLAISQIYFGPRELVHRHMLMCGDAAGMIHPLCGNGMAMAIHAAKLCAAAVADFLSAKCNRQQMEQQYQQQWQAAFSKRVTFGRNMQRLFEQQQLFSPAISLGARFPFLLKKAVAFSHGNYVS
jgi:flavin-dependent dehydrogenase